MGNALGSNLFQVILYGKFERLEILLRNKVRKSSQGLVLKVIYSPLIRYKQYRICPGIYAEGFLVFVFPFVRSYVCMYVCVCVFVRSFFRYLNENYVKVLHENFSNGDISTTTDQKAFILGPWVPWRVCLHSMNFGLRVYAPGWGWRSKSRIP